MCCRELEDVLCILSQESVRLTCIVDHPEFSTVCLNPLVLRVALAGTVAMRGERIPLPLERNSLVPRPRFPTAAGGLHHRYVESGSGK